MKKYIQNKNGITLIALIVTIIVLLILSGVTLNMVLGENGLVNQAKESKNEYEEMVKNAQGDIDKLHNELIAEKGDIQGETKVQVTSITLIKTSIKLEKGQVLDLSTELTVEPDNATNKNVIWSSSNSAIAKVDNGIVTAVSGGSATIIVKSTDGSNVSATCLITVIAKELPSTGETKPYLPGDDFHQVPGTDLSNGLVIEDGIGNQYVWIEVPRTTTVYPTAGLNITNFTEEEYTKIENDLHTYTDYYRRNKSGTLTSYTDTYYADSTTGWFTSATEYNTLKQKMLKSVYQNGGFWIGRYEAGIETNRTSSGEATVTPLSKPDQYPYTYVTRTQAHVLAQQVNSGNYTSSLMFGVQWDLVLKFLETKGVSQSDLRSNSTSWGNYENSTFPLDRGKYAKNGALSTWYNYNQDLANCVQSGVKQSASDYENSILLTTGASDETKKMNIYDLAGNVWEWTLEYTSITYAPCALRGGFYYHYGWSNPASYRGANDTTGSNDDGGFRLSLF